MSSSGATRTASSAPATSGMAFVAYGLGNFVYFREDGESGRSGVLQVTITGREVDKYSWVPTRITHGIPVPLTGAAGAADVDGVGEPPQLQRLVAVARPHPRRMRPGPDGWRRRVGEALERGDRDGDRGALLGRERVERVIEDLGALAAPLAGGGAPSA